MIVVREKNRFFPGDWKNLLLKPYYNGVILTICWVLPCYLAFLGLHSFMNNEIVEFVIVCCVFAVAALFTFVKKPSLLGSDVKYVQPDFLQMIARKNKNGKGRVA